MLRTYEEESGIAPQNESDIMLRLRVLAGEIYNERAYADYIMRQMFPTTAVGEYLDAHALQRGLQRKNATFATGTLSFSVTAEEHDDILIPAGTVVCIKDSLLRYITDSDAILRDGALSVVVPATAEQAGSAYNIIGGKFGIMVTPVLGIEEVRNNIRFSGGTDTESDELLRERVLDSYRNISNSVNAAYYHSVAMSVDGVYSAAVVGCGHGTGTVDVYLSAHGSAVSQDVLSEVQAKLNEARELNVSVGVYRATAMSVNLYIRLTVEDGYDFDTVAAEVHTAVTQYINDLGVGKNLWLSDVGEIIYHIKGVAGYKFLETYGSDREIPPSRYAIAGTILVRDE